MNKDIEISTLKKGDVSVIKIRGDLTAITGAAVEDAYKKESTAGARKILLYFDKEGYINSGGIAILIGMASESRKNEQIMRFTGLSDHFQKIFNMVGLTKYIEIFHSEESALEGF
jgi:anti-anti-sigma factor